MKLININVGPNDAFLRIIAGLILIAFVVIGLKLTWGWIGIILIVTGAVRRCPVYLMAGINTQRS